MFCFKGTVSQDFWLQVFSWIIFPQASENPQFCGLTFYICGPSTCGAICGFADPIFFAICEFAICWPKFIADLQLQQLWKFFMFMLINTYLKCSTSIFYLIKNSAKQTCSWLLDSFAIKGGNFVKRCLILSVLKWKICRFAVCGLVHQQNLRICNLRINEKKFADSHTSEILRICDCGLSPRISGS